MERQLVWTHWYEEVGLEHLQLWSTGEGYNVDSWLIGVDDIPYRVAYQLVLDETFRVRKVSIQTEQARQTSTLELLADGEGNWTSQSQVIGQFEGCVDIDLTGTPFTNSLPIRRLKLRPEQSQSIEVLYITLPKLKLSREKQRYTCLELDEAGGLYRFESLDKSQFKSELKVDRDGLVIEYNEAFSAVWLDD